MKISEYKKKDGKTYYKFSIYLGTNKEGKKIITSRQGFTTKKEATIEYVKLIENAKRLLNKKYTFKEVYEKWIKDYEPTVKGSTFQQTRRMLELHVLPTLSELFINDITIDDIQKLIKKIYNKTTNYKKIKNYINLVLKYAHKRDWISKNPCEFVIVPKPKPKDKKVNWLNKDELVNFLELAKNNLSIKWYAFFRLLAFTGLRRGEALALHWADINIPSKTLSVNKGLTRDKNGKAIISTPKNKGSKRIIDLDKKTIEILLEHKKEQKNTNIVFANDNGKYSCLSFPTHKLDKLKKIENIQITCHGLRHTHCSLLFESGANLGDVQDRLGHSDVQTTMNIYNHVSKDRKKLTLDNLTAFIDE